MSKCDWCDAYKHVGIRQSQWKYQWFCFGGAYFVEKCSTFGCKSSPGNFCRCARLLVTIVCEEMGLPFILMSMHLDDLYICELLHLCPSKWGWPMTRRHTWAILFFGSLARYCSHFANQLSASIPIGYGNSFASYSLDKNVGKT